MLHCLKLNNNHPLRVPISGYGSYLATSNQITTSKLLNHLRSFLDVLRIKLLVRDLDIRYHVNRHDEATFTEGLLGVNSLMPTLQTTEGE